MTFFVSNFDKSTSINDLQFLNIYSILVIFSELNFSENVIDSNKCIPSNIPEKDVTSSFNSNWTKCLPFIKNWITPYLELGTGLASFGINGLSYHIPKEPLYSYDFNTKNFWQIEANIGLDIIPQGKLNFGNSSYSLTAFAGTIFISQYLKATEQIKHDSYRNDEWTLKPFEFKFGFAVHFGLDF